MSRSLGCDGQSQEFDLENQTDAGRAGLLATDGFELIDRHGRELRTFQVLGERCSGTNVIRWLVSNNLGLVHREFGGWKHGFPGAMGISPHSLVVCVFRDAVPWLRSLYAKPFHTTPAMRALGFPDFIRAPWETVIDRPTHMGLKKAEGVKGMVLQKDRHPLTGERFGNVLALRNAKNAGFLSYASRDVNLALVRMEDVLSDKHAAMTRLAAAFDLPFSGDLVDSDANMGSGSFDRAAGVVSDADRAFIRAGLDPAIEARLGYAI